jgi:hypothetical protein
MNPHTAKHIRVSKTGNGKIRIQAYRRHSYPGLGEARKDFDTHGSRAAAAKALYVSEELIEQALIKFAVESDRDPNVTEIILEPEST